MAARTDKAYLILKSEDGKVWTDSAKVQAKSNRGAVEAYVGKNGGLEAGVQVVAVLADQWTPATGRLETRVTVSYV